jgi:hypothetical protein
MFSTITYTKEALLHLQNATPQQQRILSRMQKTGKNVCIIFPNKKKKYQYEAS